MDKEDFDKLLGFDTWYLTIVPTGSYYNCSPPVTTTDRDYLVYTPDYLDDILIKSGFVQTEHDAANPKKNSVPVKADGKPNEAFASWRKGEINLIVTRDNDYYVKHRIAGFVCKRLNLFDKVDRIMVYDAILHGEFNHEEPIFKKKNIDHFALLRSMCN